MPIAPYISCKTHRITIFLVNPEGKDLRLSWNVEEKMREMSDIQAIGAVAQNMALRALEKGVGSLWIGNIFLLMKN